MKRASIKKNPNGSVTLCYEDYYAGRVERTFHTLGSYVYEGNSQVCDGLSSRGWTLKCYGDLATTIRKQWRKIRTFKENGF